jgi:twitching motility two-component system response regulator PilG
MNDYSRYTPHIPHRPHIPPVSHNITLDSFYHPLERPASPAACIVVIDDSLTVRKIVATVLRREGYDTRAFQDGIEALRWFAEPGSRTPDVVLVDIGLPKMDGYNVIRTLKARARFAHTTCIVLSGRDGMVEKLKARLAGAALYLTKPFTTQALLAAVRAYAVREPGNGANNAACRT